MGAPTVVTTSFVWASRLKMGANLLPQRAKAKHFVAAPMLHRHAFMARLYLTVLLFVAHLH
jgi:hypothetical protein